MLSLEQCSRANFFFVLLKHGAEIILDADEVDSSDHPAGVFVVSIYDCDGTKLAVAPGILLTLVFPVNTEASTGKISVVHVHEELKYNFANMFNS
jgi:hypothetical protein